MTDAVADAPLASAERIAQLPCWAGPVEPRPLAGGRTNVNYLVEDAGASFVVRTGRDVPVHRIMRFNELAAARAAERIGISPPVVYHEPGVLVMGYIEGRTLAEADVRAPAMLERVVELMHHCHREMGRAVRGPALAFDAFHAIHDYLRTLREGASRHFAQLPEIARRADRLQQAIGESRIAYCHNDLIAANLIDDGDRLWLIDWDYAGFGNPLFDLGGLSTNNQFAPADDQKLLEFYYGANTPDGQWHRFAAMKAASVLREAMWSMVSEIHSAIDCDYEAYTAENIARFDRAWQAFLQLET